MTVAILLLLFLILVPLLAWQIRASREQSGKQAEPDAIDRVDVHDLHRGDF